MAGQTSDPILFGAHPVESTPLAVDTAADGSVALLLQTGRRGYGLYGLDAGGLAVGEALVSDYRLGMRSYLAADGRAVVAFIEQTRYISGVTEARMLVASYAQAATRPGYDLVALDTIPWREGFAAAPPLELAPGRWLLAGRFASDAGDAFAYEVRVGADGGALTVEERPDLALGAHPVHVGGVVYSTTPIPGSRGLRYAAKRVADGQEVELDLADYLPSADSASLFPAHRLRDAAGLAYVFTFGAGGGTGGEYLLDLQRGVVLPWDFGAAYRENLSRAPGGGYVGDVLGGVVLTSTRSRTRYSASGTVLEESTWTVAPSETFAVPARAGADDITLLYDAEAFGRRDDLTRALHLSPGGVVEEGAYLLGRPRADLRWQDLDASHADRVVGVTGASQNSPDLLSDDSLEVFRFRDDGVSRVARLAPAFPGVRVRTHRNGSLILTYGLTDDRQRERRVYQLDARDRVLRVLTQPLAEVDLAALPRHAAVIDDGGAVAEIGYHPDGYVDIALSRPLSAGGWDIFRRDTVQLRAGQLWMDAGLGVTDFGTVAVALSLDDLGRPGQAVDVLRGYDVTSGSTEFARRHPRPTLETSQADRYLVAAGLAERGAFTLVDAVPGDSLRLHVQAYSADGVPEVDHRVAVPTPPGESVSARGLAPQAFLAASWRVTYHLDVTQSPPRLTSVPHDLPARHLPSVVAGTDRVAHVVGKEDLNDPIHPGPDKFYLASAYDATVGSLSEPRGAATVVRVSPTISRGRVTVALAKGEAAPLSVSVLDALGRPAAYRAVPSGPGSWTIETDGLVRGFYRVCVVLASGRVLTGSFLVP